MSISKLNLLFIYLILFLTMGIYSDPHRKSKKEATKYYFVNGSTALLYLYPNKKSEIISSVPYGEILTIDSTAISDVSKNWIPLVTNSKLSGFVLRGEVIPIDQKKRFSIIKKDIQEKFTDPRNRKDIVLWKQITNFLFTSSENGNFTGEEYVFFRVFSGESLSNALFAMQSDGLTNWEIKHQDFVAKYKQYLTKDSDTSYMRLDENFFWKYASLNENSRYAEIAANLALKNSPKIDCKGEPICYLIDLNNTKVRYLRFFSKSKNLKKMSNQIILALEEFTSDKESIRCFPPQPDYNYQIFYQVRYARYFLYESDIPKFDSKYKIIEEECFPHL